MRRSGAKPSRAAVEAPGLNDLSRRQLLQAGAGLALAGYGLSGCTVSRQVDRSTAGQVIKPEVDGDLLLYNWAQYMDPTLKKDFSEKYGVEVTEVNFDNLEAMVVKLRSGAQYDMIWPSTEPLNLPIATNVRFTALSMISTDSNSVIRLRRRKMPAVPMLNSRAERNR